MSTLHTGTHIIIIIRSMIAYSSPWYRCAPRGVIRFSHPRLPHTGVRARVKPRTAGRRGGKPTYSGYQHRERRERERWTVSVSMRTLMDTLYFCNPTNNAVDVVGCGSFFVALESTLASSDTLSRNATYWKHRTSGNKKCQTHLVSKIKKQELWFPKTRHFFLLLLKKTSTNLCAQHTAYPSITTVDHTISFGSPLTLSLTLLSSRLDILLQ